MNKRILIKVEQKHINLGLRGNCGNCPIAQAIKEQHKTTYVSVGSRDASILLNKVMQHFTLPRVATRFINKFDMEYNCKPFNFYLKPKN